LEGQLNSIIVFAIALEYDEGYVNRVRLKWRANVPKLKSATTLSFFWLMVNVLLVLMREEAGDVNPDFGFSDSGVRRQLSVDERDDK